MKQNKTRQILARQKLRATLQPLPENYKLPKLTAEERKLIYAPKPATEAPQHLRSNEWVEGWKQTQKPRRIKRVAKATAKTTIWGLGMLTAIAGGILAGETKRGLHS